MSEYNQSAPNDYGAEIVPQMFGQAIAQDWDGIFLFFIEPKSGEAIDWVNGFHNINNNPAKQAMLPLFSRLFRQDSLSVPTIPATTLSIPISQLPNYLAHGNPPYTLWWATYGNVNNLIFSPAQIEYIPTGTNVLHSGSPGTNPHFSWDATKGLYTGSFPTAAFATGLQGGQSISVGPVRFTMPTSWNNFASWVLSAVDGKPLSQSSHLILALVGYVGNPDYAWSDASRTCLTNWGTQPLQVEGIASTVQLQTDAISATVRALDNTGAPQMNGSVSSTLSNGLLSFQTDKVYRTLWYDIQVQQRPSSPLADSNSGTPKVYPNPWRADKHAQLPVTFSGISEQATVKIFTISGHLVTSLTGNDPAIVWNLTNRSGQRVASGIYLYLIEQPDRPNAKGQLAIIQ